MTVHYKILKCSTEHENLLLSFLMIIIQLHLKLTIHRKRWPSNLLINIKLLTPI